MKIQKYINHVKQNLSSATQKFLQQKSGTFGLIKKQKQAVNQITAANMSTVGFLQINAFENLTMYLEKYLT